MAISEDDWNKLVNKYNESKVYHLAQWGSLLKGAHGYRLVYLQENAGVFPLAYIRSKIFRNRLISLPFADYGGPCAQDRDTANKLITNCEKAAEDLGVDFVEVRCPNEGYFDIFADHGFVRGDDYLTFILTLSQGIDPIWKAMRDKNRNMVRKAGRSGVQIVEGTSKADLEVFYWLYRKTMKKLGSPPQPYQFFTKMWDLFYPSSIMLPLAKYQEQYIAGGVFLLHNNTIQHAYSSSLARYLKLAPNDLIQWYMIKWGAEHNFAYLDFGRSRRNEGTVLFKKRWGGEEVKMPYFYKFYNGQLRERPEKQYRWLSSLWRKYMPEFVANRLGPRIITQIG